MGAIVYTFDVVLLFGIAPVGRDRPVAIDGPWQPSSTAALQHCSTAALQHCTQAIGEGVM
jgi:hypothetical protein